MGLAGETLVALGVRKRSGEMREREEEDGTNGIGTNFLNRLIVFLLPLSSYHIFSDNLNGYYFIATIG